MTAVETLPALPPAIVDEPGRPEERNTKKVLIIDDSPEIRMLICETLGCYGYITTDAGDGERGIQLAKELLPDLIICDISMPGLDGYDTLKALRAHEATATVPFVFLTGATDKAKMRRGMELGADDYLTKPFSHQELMAAVQARMEKQAELRRQSEKKLDELRGSLSLALPHELRTPLNGILGLASLMMEDAASMDPEEVLESARYIHESASRLHRLIENFLVYSQIQILANKSSRIQIAEGIKPIAVDAVVPHVVETVAARYQREQDLRVELVSANLLLPEENFSKIIEELIDNAFKFSTKGQNVRIATQVIGKSVCFRIEDQGRGMTRDQISRVGPHMQFDREIYEQQGAGLGLVIARRLTELLGGTFKIESATEKGVAVQLSFPLFDA
jgi:signal transduction histidine kinase